MTDKNQVLSYWQKFFSDLLIGTFVNLFLFGIIGFTVGMIGTYSLKEIYIGSTDWSGWLQWLVLITALLWYGIWGPIHGVIASIIETARGKFRQMVGGLQDLLDILVSGVLANYPNVNKSIPKEELARKFDEIGKKFLDDLKLKGGPINWMKGLFFRAILKVLKFIFLDDVMEELNKKGKDHLDRADIESAVRRVGVEFVISTLTDQMLILQGLNVLALAVTFGLPFFLFWYF
ncbi:MAG: hypothetical protein OEM27_03250 [Nitrospinota bacterium]|nr:hypothetical protein [Nitrospinota bacterium]